MGQAKLRGSKEERMQNAIDRQDVAPDYRSREWFLRMMLSEGFVKQIETVALKENISEQATLSYTELLKYMWDFGYYGACHSSSAILYVLMSELGLKPHLCIGEVRAGRQYFDHSWVELDGAIYDVAVSLPDPSGGQVGGPVFASIDLSNGEKTPLQFGISDGSGLDVAAQVASKNTLKAYAEVQETIPDAGPNIWHKVVKLAPMVGLKCTVQELSEKYGHLKREYRNNVISN